MILPLLPDPSENQSEEDGSFLRHDSALDDNNTMVGDSRRFLIYISKRGLDKLIKYGQWAMDAIFKSIFSLLFYILFTFSSAFFT